MSWCGGGQSGGNATVHERRHRGSDLALSASSDTTLDIWRIIMAAQRLRTLLALAPGARARTAAAAGAARAPWSPVTVAGSAAALSVRASDMSSALHRERWPWWRAASWASGAVGVATALALQAAADAHAGADAAPTQMLLDQHGRGSMSFAAAIGAGALQQIGNVQEPCVDGSCWMAGAGSTDGRSKDGSIQPSEGKTSSKLDMFFDACYAAEERFEAAKALVHECTVHDGACTACLRVCA